MSVEGKLLLIFVEFVDMLLSLSHEGNQFELSAAAPVHSLQLEVNLLNRSAHLFQIFILIHPFARNVVKVHIETIISLIAVLFSDYFMPKVGALKVCACK